MPIAIDAPSCSPQPLRGLMLDVARLVESPDYYRRFIDFCADWQVNTILFRLADDQGCALRFQSHPELVTHPNALTPETAGELVKHARDRGVDLIPEIESLGHSHYITRTSEHAGLDDTGGEGPAWANAMIPLHPETLRILGDLYEETAALFPSCYLHAGCDEARWGGSGYSRELLRTRPRSHILAEHLNALNARIRALGREMIIWDDSVLQQDASILDRLDRGIILLDWQYANTTAEPVLARLTLGLGKGFRMIGGPALCWARGPRPGTKQLRNIDAYADAYGSAHDARALGVIVTNWQPTTYLQRSLWDGLAYAAVAIAEGSVRARETAFRRFVEGHYGAAWDNAWAEIFDTLYNSTPTRENDAPVPFFAPWASAGELDRAIRANRLYASPCASILARIDGLRDRVRRNPNDFAAFRLSVAYLAHLYWRQDEVVATAREGRDPNGILKEIARRDAAMEAELAADWNDGRTGDPAAGMEKAADWGFDPADWLHGRFQQAARGSAALVRLSLDVIAVTTATGTSFCMLPPAGTQPAPTLLLLATAGADTLNAEPYSRIGRLLHARGWTVASLDLPCHGADRRAGEPAELAGWAVRIGQGEDIVKTFQRRVNDVLEHLVKTGSADPRRIAAAGTSRGGFLVFHAAAGNPRLRAVAAFSPVTDLIVLAEFAGQEANPLVRRLALVNAVDALADRAIWITIGNADERVGTDKAVAFAHALKAEAARRTLAPQVTLHVVPTPGHASFHDWHDEAAGWLKSR